MIITGRKLHKSNVIIGIKEELLQVQSVGIDLRIKSIYDWKSKGVIDFENIKRKLPKIDEKKFLYGKIFLKPGGYYVEFAEQIKVPSDAVGFIYPRSSLMRCGVILNSSLFDPGYEGPITSIIQVINKYGIELHKDARIATCIFNKSDGTVIQGYEGIYQRKEIVSLHT